MHLVNVVLMQYLSTSNFNELQPVSFWVISFCNNNTFYFRKLYFFSMHGSLICMCAFIQRRNEELSICLKNLNIFCIKKIIE